ncbi:MAG: MoaD/ThiS family protein [Thermoplasmata archaeon]
MKVRLRLLNPLRQTVGASRLEIDFSGGSVESFLIEAGKKHPKLGEAMFTKEGGIDYSINIILNGKPLTESGMKNQVKEGDEVVLLAAAAGG